MAKLTLTNPSEDELNVAFSTEIAGWRDVRFEEDEDVDIESRTIYPWKGMAGWPPDGGKRRLIPRWTECADAVLPWLYKHHWEVNQTSSASHPIRVVLDDMHGPRGESGTFPRAATIALLRAHGVEITFTKEIPT